MSFGYREVRVAVCFCVFLCVAVCCSVLQCVMSFCYREVRFEDVHRSGFCLYRSLLRTYNIHVIFEGLYDMGIEVTFEDLAGKSPGRVG